MKDQKEKPEEKAGDTTLQNSNDSLEAQDSSGTEQAALDGEKKVMPSATTDEQNLLAASEKKVMPSLTHNDPTAMALASEKKVMPS